MRQIYYLVIILFIILLFIGLAKRTANPVEISVQTPSQAIRIGQEFTVNISIDPVTNPISGAQFSLVFDGSLANIKNISEGQIFKMNGAKTLFNPGVLNNSTGNLVNAWGLIITPGASVNKKNNFAEITFISSNAGAFKLNLTNVIICNPNSASIPTRVSNISLNIVNNSASLPNTKDSR